MMLLGLRNKKLMRKRKVCTYIEDNDMADYSDHADLEEYGEEMGSTVPDLEAT